MPGSIAHYRSDSREGGGGVGDSNIKKMGMLVENNTILKLTPKGDQSGCGSGIF